MSKKEIDIKSVLGTDIDKRKENVLKKAAASKEAENIAKQLDNIDKEKILQKFRTLDAKTMKEKLENLNMEDIKNAMANTKKLDEFKKKTR